MKCVVCGTPVPHRLVSDGGMNPWCSEPCGAKWRTRNNFLFDLRGKPTLTREQILGMVVDKGYLDSDERTLGRLAQVSTTIRPLAKEHEVGAQFHAPAVHQQQQGMKTIETVTNSMQKTGRFVTVDKVTKAGKPYQRTVPEMRAVPKVTRTSVPNIVRTDISADQMLEIALMAYNTAIELKGKSLPVILYRVTSKGTLNKSEKNTQTLSSSVHASVGGTEVWPLQKTAAWIQGAMRARISFVLLNDPRGEDILIGGIDKASDAIYVRELHQITSMHYTIGVAGEAQTPSGLKGKKIFVLNPPEKTLGVMPLVPRITPDHWSHTWNSAKSNLTLGDRPSLIRNHLRTLFAEAGTRLGVPAY